MQKRAIIFFVIIAGLAAVFGYFYYNQNPFVVSSSADPNKTITVLANKKWVLSFSQQFNQDSVTEDTIYVTDKNGDRVEVSLNFTGDRVTVYPPDEGYNPENAPFQLHISDEIESVDGETLRNGEKITFHPKVELPTLSSQKELNSIFKDRLAKMKKEKGFAFGRGGMESSESVSDDSAANSKANTAGESDGASHSDTNVQVQGVDEADIVKTDGEYIYQAIDQKLKITKALPADDIQTVAELRFKDFNPYQLYVDGNQLVIIGHHWMDVYESQTKDKAAILPIYETTRMMIYDITDPADPVVQKSMTLEGSYISSRKIDNHVYLLTNQYADYWMLEEHPEIDLRPRKSETTDNPEEEVEMEPISYSDIHYFPDSAEDNFMTIASIDLRQTEDEATILTYLGSGQQIYMSKENLYVAVPNYTAEGGSNWFQHENTDLYKFSVNGLQVEYSSTGTIPGYLLNQFSMDEYNGYFRVAATKGQAWDKRSPSSNNLFIMDDQLNVISSVEDLARGERIYSVRFMQEKAYVVTFKEVDPLFVFDLSDPNDPKVLGELKIPGFSNYLHPYNENHLIGFGHHTKVVKDLDGTRVTTDGVKISLFDVSDPSDPIEKHTEIIGGSATYSPLNYDHKALLFNKEKDIFAFPVVVYKENEKYDYRFEFEGAVVYGIDPEKGFTLHTKITHQKEKTIYEDWENSVQRILYINDHLYTVTPKEIRANKITW